MEKGELNRDPEQLGVGVLEPEGFFLGLGRDLQDAGGTDSFDRVIGGGGGHSETLDKSQVGRLDRRIERGSQIGVQEWILRVHDNLADDVLNGDPQLR